MNPSHPVDLIAVIPCREGRGAEVLGLLREYAVHVNADPGCDRFEVYVDRDDSDRIVVLERYRDDAGFAAHIADPANAELNVRLASLTQGGSQLQFLVGDQAG